MMARLQRSLLASVLGLLAAAATTTRAEMCHLYSATIESPCFTLERNATSYELRQYHADEYWTDAHIDTRMFAYAQNRGFMANFDYISGENSMEMKIPMTAPVIFRKSVDEKGWQVSFYVPSKFETMEAIPVPKNKDIKIMTLGPSTYAVRVFSGFASHWDFVAEETKLKRDLLNDGVKLSDDPINGVVYAGYDSPFVYNNRHNEVWVKVA